MKYYFIYSMCFIIFNILFLPHRHVNLFLSTHITNVFEIFLRICFRIDVNSLEFFANLRFLIEPIISLSECINQRQRELIHYTEISQKTDIRQSWHCMHIRQLGNGNLLVTLYPRNDLCTLPMHLLNEYLTECVDLLGALLDVTT